MLKEDLLYNQKLVIEQVSFWGNVLFADKKKTLNHR